VNASIEKLKNNPNLKWEVTVIDDEIFYEKTFHKSLKIIIKKNNIQLDGSIHKFHNQGIHNYNDFNFIQIQNTIKELKKNLSLNPYKTRLNNVEFGVNVITSFKPKVFLERLIMHKGKGFNKDKKKNIYYRQCEHEQYIIKIYDKGLQFKLSQNIMRFEIKVTTMQFLKGIGLNYLSDLNNKEIFLKLGEILNQIWNEILFSDLELDINKLNSKENILFVNGKNPMYWESLYESAKKSGSQKGKRDRALNDFKKIIEKYGDGIPKEIGISIKNKWNELLNTNYESGSIKKQIKLSKTKNLIPCEISDIHINQNITNRADLDFIYSINPLNSTNVCIVTGIDISHQKENSKFVSAKTILNNPELEKNSIIRSGKKRLRKCKESNSYYAAHNLRNKDSNPRNNLKRRLYKSISQTTLFDPKEIIKLNEEQKRILGVSLNEIKF